MSSTSGRPGGLGSHQTGLPCDRDAIKEQPAQKIWVQILDLPGLCGIGQSLSFSDTQSHDLYREGIWVKVLSRSGVLQVAKFVPRSQKEVLESHPLAPDKSR